MFLTETRSSDSTQLHFNPHGEASNRLNSIAAGIITAIQASNDPKYADLDEKALTDYVYDYVKGCLAGPFASIMDIDSAEPILVLNDMSYSSVQLFRAFSGVYCDFTPVLPISKADFLEFTIHHEVAHKKTEEIIRDGPNNNYLPGIELGTDEDSISHTNLTESIADTYAVLRHIQRTGSSTLPQQIAAMRTLSIFSQSFKQFATAFTINMGAGTRQRAEVEHYTAPSIDAAIPRAMKLYQSGRLQRMSEAQLVNLAIAISRESKTSSAGLSNLSQFATSLTFNALREPDIGNIPHFKNSISPGIVETVLGQVQEKGDFIPRGADSVELRFLSFGEDQGVPILDDTLVIFDRYRQAVRYLKENGLPAFSTELSDFFVSDLNATLELPANQNPNTTIAREMNDSWASRYKYTALDGHQYNLVGVRQLLKHCNAERDTSSLEKARAYVRATDGKPRTEDYILRMFAEL